MRKPSQVKDYVRYVTTRPNAEKFEMNQSQREATKYQKRWVGKELKTSKGLRESCEQGYEDYLQNPAKENAVELINKTAEEGLIGEDSMESYAGYLAKRPRAERGKQGHALWNGSNKEIDLSQVAEEAAKHNGNIQAFILSLRREDAVHLGYDNDNIWRRLVRGKAPEITKAVGIPIEHFAWYGAFHNEGHHPHIHLMCYSKKPKEGYLGSKNLMKLKSSFANEIFHDELCYIYEQKDEVRDKLKSYFNRKLKQAMTMEYADHPRVEALLWELSQRLKIAKHKRVYGRLEKESKILVDEIVEGISRNRKISQVYESWLRSKGDILSTHQNQERARGALAEEPEFHNIKNMVLKSALVLLEMNEVVAAEPEERNHKIMNPQESWQERTRKHHQMQAQKQLLLLMKHISHTIKEGYDRKKQRTHVDEKLMREIIEKKEAHGQRM